ncbi:MAG TPA: hypothetical protein P5294_09510 [Smithellaceae bacterium]|nr:hypothetical protein [Smithellaceae bacterium]HRS89929.1 hypothetical protein [Smithellaceae bacterium]HRV26766.1 hypothetical protein [Smithellaceae bacterium]
MPVYIQILLFVVGFVLFVFLALYLGGLGIRRLCFKIIAEMEESQAFNEARSVTMQEDRQNFFRVGTKNLRPRALNVLISEGLVIKTKNGRYYLDKEKVSALKNMQNNQ